MIYSRRFISFIISVLIFTGAVMGGMTVTVSAASLTGGETGKSVYTYLGNSKDGKGWKNPHLKNSKQMKYSVKINGETKVGYCMEPGQAFDNNHKYTAKAVSKAKAWTGLSAARQRVLALVMFYGYNKGKSAPYGNTNDYYAATQTLVWEAVDGDITLSKTGKWSKSSNEHDNMISGREYAEKNYKWIKEKISAHVKGAGFTASSYSSAPTYLMKYNYSNKNWSCTLKDSDKGNYLKKHKDTSDSLSLSRSGYSYTFKTKTAGTKKAVLVNDVKSGTSQALLVLVSAKAANQSLVFGATDDTAFYTKLRTEEKGKCKLVKTSDDGKVDGFKFKVTCSSNGYSAVHTTDADGVISMELYPGEYTVAEQLTAAQKEDGYVQAKAKKVTVKEKETSTVKIHNKKLPKGSHILIEKENDDGSSPEGFRFELTNKATGKKLECVTDEDGTAFLEDVELGEYTVTEILSEEQKVRFEEPESQSVSVKEDGQTVSVSFTNMSRSTPVTLKKVCVDGNVSDIDFKIYGETAWGEVVATRDVCTAEDGTISLGDLKPGTYTIEEVLPDDGRYLHREPKTFTVTGSETEPVEVVYENVPTSLYVTKVDSVTKGFVEGASFELLDSDGIRLLGFSVIREDGRVTLEPEVVDSELFIYDDPDKTEFGCIRGMTIGEAYTLREICAPEGYTLSEDKTFVFEEAMEITVENVQIVVEPEEPETPPAEPEPEPEAPPEEPAVRETEPVEKPVPEKAVETGDTENMLIPMALMLFAIGIVCVLVFRKENQG